MLGCGFESVGNASVIVYDRAPILVTDPWIGGGAYFGSWTLTHEIPEEQIRAIHAAEYIWFSHGHPDHLNPESVELFKGKKILLPDHHGGRIKKDLEQQGFQVEVLPDRKWVKLSERVRVLCIADYNQDGIILIDINGRLVINTNDASDKGWFRFVRQEASKYPISFLLALTGFGDADMIHFYDENGRRLPPVAAKRFPVGQAIAGKLQAYGAKYFVPSSSLHKYQRADSVWANEYTTKLEDYAEGFNAKSAELLPAFVSYDCANDTWRTLDPKENRIERPLDPSVFGDNWTDSLEKAEFAELETYFKSVRHLESYLDFLNFKVGGKDHFVQLNRKRPDRVARGITFEVPRGSLTTSVKYQIFDDLLIGNFMKTTLHGKWPRSGLYPDFTPYVTKYADNGLAKTKEELEAYFAEYQRRSGFDFLMHRLERTSKDLFRTYIPAESRAFQSSKRLYWDMKKRLG